MPRTRKSTAAETARNASVEKRPPREATVAVRPLIAEIREQAELFHVQEIEALQRGWYVMAGVHRSKAHVLEQLARTLERRVKKS